MPLMRAYVPMGAAEQRRAERHSAAAQIQAAARRRSEDNWHLVHIGSRREMLATAEADVRGRRAGLRAAIAMALDDAEDRPTDAEIAKKSGWTLEQLDAFREELRTGRASPENDEAPAG